MKKKFEALIATGKLEASLLKKPHATLINELQNAIADDDFDKLAVCMDKLSRLPTEIKVSKKNCKLIEEFKGIIDDMKKESGADSDILNVKLFDMPLDNVLCRACYTIKVYTVQDLVNYARSHIEPWKKLMFVGKGRWEKACEILRNYGVKI